MDSRRPQYLECADVMYVLFTASFVLSAIAGTMLGWVVEDARLWLGLVAAVGAPCRKESCGSRVGRLVPHECLACINVDRVWKAMLLLGQGFRRV
ncbi:hypothetical protein Micbo1qcDRAFT_161188, partial [Microdochium bolleyi]